MTDDPVLPTYALDGNVATITLDDGKANALSTPVIVALDALLDRAHDDKARALLIVGRPGKLSAGFNLEEMTGTPESMRNLVVRGGRWLLRLYAFPMPTVVASTGHALAGGALILLAADVRIGADVPAKIGLNEVAIGMALPRFALALAHDRLLRSHVNDATLGARIYDPAGAVAAGYLDRVVPADAVVAEARAEALRLAELRTGAYARTKANARQALVDHQVEEIIGDMASITGPEV